MIAHKTKTDMNKEMRDSPRLDRSLDGWRTQTITVGLTALVVLVLVSASRAEELPDILAYARIVAWGGLVASLAALAVEIWPRLLYRCAPYRRSGAAVEVVAGVGFAWVVFFPEETWELYPVSGQLSFALLGGIMLATVAQRWQQRLRRRAGQTVVSRRSMRSQTLSEPCRSSAVEFKRDKSTYSDPKSQQDRAHKMRETTSSGATQ